MEVGQLLHIQEGLLKKGQQLQRGKVASTPPTLNGSGTAAAQSGGTAEEGTAATTRKNSSQKPNPDSSSSSSVSSSSGDKMLTSSTSSSSSDSSSSGKSKALKEKSLVASDNNNAGAPSNLANGKEICQNGRARGKEGAGEKKEPALTINGGKEKRGAANGKEGRTTMMIRLHPGRTNKLSAYLENQEKPGSRTWLTEAQTEEAEDALCGLEISFSSVPQDIDIKLLSPTQGDGHLEGIET